MKIAVCVKLIDGELNPFDECALEEALKIPEAEVYVVSMCPLSVKDKLQSLTRLGVKKVYLLSDTAYAGSDTLATSYILSEWLKKDRFDLVFCGRQTIDGDTAQVGPCLATMLGIKLITNVMQIKDVTTEKIDCETRMGAEIADLPALLTIERINTLRLPSIFSKLGEIEIVNNEKVGAETAYCGLHGSPTKVLKTFENVRGKRMCKFITHQEFNGIFAEVVNKEKNSENFKESEVKLKNVWAIGNIVAEKARLIAENVEIIDESEPEKIAELALEEKPEVILWNADLWGRKNAPIVSAILKTGLCADCTHLETDGNRLYMYRPAKGGNIVAKIECRTNPQMATVRCTQKTDDVIVAGGRGIVDCLEDLKKFADMLNAELGASRALVDKGVIPYEKQIGLTGKMVNPKIYIAVGISGSVQHTCAIEKSDTVIAINPDKDAAIFDYADYGIISTFEDFMIVSSKNWQVFYHFFEQLEQIIFKTVRHH